MEKEKQVTEEVNHNDLVDTVIGKVKDNKNNFYFYCPPLNSPSGGIGVLIRLAKTLLDAGFNSKIVYEPRQDQKASYEASAKANK